MSSTPGARQASRPVPPLTRRSVFRLTPSYGWASGWIIGVVLTAAALSLPVAVVFAHLFTSSGDVWAHLASTVLADYAVNSLLLMLGVAVGALIGGVGGAWLRSMHQFPGRGVFEWALLLPMALPAYVVAYSYTGLLDVGGGRRSPFSVGSAQFATPHRELRPGALECV